MSKSQSAMEFTVLAAFMLLVVLGFFAVTSSKVLESNEGRQRQVAEGIANYIYREIEIAKSVNDGYVRLFSMPATIEGINYNINITDNRELIVNYTNNEIVKPLPANVTGVIGKGIVIIKKINGIVYINVTQSICGNEICELGEGCMSCSADCGPCPSLLRRIFFLKENGVNAVSFDTDGNVIVRGDFRQNVNSLVRTAVDEYIIKDSSGNDVAIVDLLNGHMNIIGGLSENQPTPLTPPVGNNIIIKDATGNVVSYISESGNLVLKGKLTPHGNP